MENVNQLTQQPVSDDALQGISELAEEQLRIENEIITKNLELEKLNEQLSRYRDTLIPDAMSAVGMSSFKLKDGTSVVVNPFYSASIPADRAKEAFKWLRDNQFGELIKHVIGVTFGKGDDELAKTVASKLTELKVPFVDKESVHPQTLKAFVRERTEKGEDLPKALLGVYIGNRAKITPAK
jgi:hypothetical protein